MPTDCDPWPGKRKAIGDVWLIVRSVSRDRRLGVQSREFAGDRFIHMAFGKLGRYANRVLDSVGVRRTMRDKTNTLHSEQRGSAIFSVVEAFFEIGKCVAREQCA